MPSQSRTLFARGTRVTLAAAALTVALAGCTVEVSGTAAPRPDTPSAVFPVESAPPTTAPRPGTPSVPASSIDPAVYAEWVAAGWTPTPLQRVQDPDSLTSAHLLGTPEYTPLRGANGKPSPATHYVAKGAPASVFTDFMVHPYPAGATPDPQRAATAMAEGMNGYVVSAQPLTVSGYPGLDVRIEATTDNGRPFVALIRFVKLPEHLVALGAAGGAQDDRVIGQVHDIIVETLRLPSV
jgi:hypothetical protein